MPEATLPAAPPASKRNPLSIFWGVVVRPRATFDHLREHGGLSWLWPALVLALLGVIAIIVTSPITQRLQREQMERQGVEVPAEQLQQLEAITTNPLITIVLPSVMSLIGLAIGFVIQAAVWHFASLALGGQSRFEAMFRAAVWATALPSALRTLVTMSATAATGAIRGGGLSALVSTPEGQIMPTEPALGALYAFLSGIDVFWVWAMALSVIAVAATARFSWRKGMLVAFTYWLLTVAVGVGGTWLSLSLAAQFGGLQ